MAHGVDDVDFLALLDSRARAHAASSLQFKLAEVVEWHPDAEPPSATFKTLPDGLTTGDLPVGAAWAGSPGATSGALGGPEKGTLALLGCLDAEGQMMMCLTFFGSTKNSLPAVPSGEYWVFHKSGSYVKLGNDEHVKVHGTQQVDIVAPVVQLSDALDGLSDDNAIVRKKDLQAVINYIKGHTHIGNLGAATSSPVVPCADAQASSVAKAK
jgi:hypothetical protein